MLGSAVWINTNNKLVGYTRTDKQQQQTSGCAALYKIWITNPGEICMGVRPMK